MAEKLYSTPPGEVPGKRPKHDFLPTIYLEILFGDLPLTVDRGADGSAQDQPDDVGLSAAA